MAAVAALAVLASNCGGSAAVPSPASSAAVPSPTSSNDAATQSAPTGGPTADRPYEVFVPTSYTSSVPMPLVMLLHGIGTSSSQMESIIKLQPMTEERGFLYVHPDGTKDTAGDPFWNATDGCCNAYDLPVDDSAYLDAVIDEVRASYNVDPKRIYLVGVSNGGFMAYRMACDHADKIAAIVSLAGATFLDATRCRPSAPVSVLEVHGTADEIVPYNGGQLVPGHPFPSTPTTVAEWATYNGCESDLAPTRLRLDIAAAVPGDETEVSRFDRCPAGGAVELWTVKDATHIYQLTPAFTAGIVDFLLAHPKP